MSSIILVKFGDNDFYYTWNAVLESAITDESIFDVKDKKKLAFILSQAAWGMYCLHQNRCSYNGLENFDFDYIKHMQEYLSIDETRVLLDEEATDYFQSHAGWGNCESFYIQKGCSEVSVM